jgi:hypothetical protein
MYTYLDSYLVYCYTIIMYLFFSYHELTEYFLGDLSVTYEKLYVCIPIYRQHAWLYSQIFM